MADTLPGMSYIDMLKTQYDVVGGYSYKAEQVRREGYEINEILIQSLAKHVPSVLNAYKIRAQRRRIYMFSIKDDSLGDDLPVFMVRLQDGNTVTCYPCDIEELAMDEIADDIELHEGGEVI